MRICHDILLEFSDILLAKQKIEMLFLYRYYLRLGESKTCRAEETYHITALLSKR